ncbi:MAG: GreA/GreB family elongation factor, partial [Fischerella sp.]|uniref:GreA/GreB family elongation factor n=1 Tax=Fischerella sp. TaxID=1191 RepID=UPI0017BF46E7
STRVVTLVGSEETRSAEPGEGKISIDSPIGEAINNAKVGDTVVAKLPDKEIEFKILKFVN